MVENIGTRWTKQPSENSVETERSHLSENGSNIKYNRKLGRVHEEYEAAKRSRRSDSFDIETHKLRNSQLCQDQVKFSQSNLNNNDPCLNSNMISDDNTRPSSTLAFRPWGSHKDGSEENRVSLNYPPNTPNSHLQSFKGINR